MSFPAKVKTLFEKLNESGQFTTELATRLCDIQYCQEKILQTAFPVLRVEGESELDADGIHRRYYSSNNYHFEIKGQNYIFTNDWVARNAGALQQFFGQSS